HHYTEAGLIEPAIKYWRDAGERAQRRWANVEAVKHLSRGIDLLRSMPTGVDRNRTELGLLATLGLAMGALKGYNATETQQLYSRAQALLDADAALNEQLTVLNGRFVAHFVSAEYDKGREVATQILGLGSRHPAASSLG